MFLKEAKSNFRTHDHVILYEQKFTGVMCVTFTTHWAECLNDQSFVMCRLKLESITEEPEVTGEKKI